MITPLYLILMISILYLLILVSRLHFTNGVLKRKRRAPNIEIRSCSRWERRIGKIYKSFNDILNYTLVLCTVTMYYSFIKFEELVTKQKNVTTNTTTTENKCDEIGITSRIVDRREINLLRICKTVINYYAVRLESVISLIQEKGVPKYNILYGCIRLTSRMIKHNTVSHPITMPCDSKIKLKLDKALFGYTAFLCEVT